MTGADCVCGIFQHKHNDQNQSAHSRALCADDVKIRFMNTEASLTQYGLKPKASDLPAIRALLREQLTTLTQHEEETDEDLEELVYLCCVQLFAAAEPEDILLIWEAKESSFDMNCLIDVQLLCGLGMNRTRKYLSGLSDPDSREVLAYLAEAEVAGDFDEFTPEKQLAYYRQYFAQPA